MFPSVTAYYVAGISDSIIARAIVFVNKQPMLVPPVVAHYRYLLDTMPVPRHIQLWQTLHNLHYAAKQLRIVQIM